MRGKCLCGGIEFEIILPGIGINNCHCSRCRKSSGSAFGSFFHTTSNRFKFIKGEENVSRYVPPQGDPRPFCRTCGSRVPFVDLEDEHVIIPAGLLEGDPELEASVNIHTASKAEWYKINDGLPSFSESAPDELWERYFNVFQEKLRRS